MAPDRAQGLIYFDHAATTPLDPRVREAMEPHFSDAFGNPSEPHGPGRRARRALDEARAAVAAALNANEREIVFTSRGTEADNLALFGVAQRFASGHLIVSAVEHQAVLEAARALNRRGWDVDFVPVDGYGVIDRDAYEAAFREDTRLVSVMLANNVVGTLQPVAELAAIAHEHGVPLHTDAVQALGSVPVDVQALGVDLLTVSAHKVYGPKGVGALYVRRGTRLEPLLYGGGHERRLRSGTENVPGIVGFATAVQLAVADLERSARHVAALRDRLVAGVLERVPEVRYLGHPQRRLPGNAAFAVRHVEGEAMLLGLDQHGIAVSTGSACASGSLEPSHVLLALGLRPEEAHGSLRVTLGRENTAAEVERFLDVFPAVVARLREMSPLYAAG